ncbi:hypothetical protein BST61_g10333 [Cercospora zeina]
MASNRPPPSQTRHADRALGSQRNVKLLPDVPQVLVSQIQYMPEDAPGHTSPKLCEVWRHNSPARELDDCSNNCPECRDECRWMGCG